MQTHFEHELGELKTQLLTMASHAESAVTHSMKSLAERNDELAAKVEADDEILDQFEIEIDELAIGLLSKAPLASDLRLITVAMKVSQNLERIGDEATKISRRARDLNREAPLKHSVDLANMAKIALEMLKSSLDSFVNRDPERARQVIPRDKEVDSLNKQLHRELASFMVKNPDAIARCLHLMVISKSLERIADHATNVAEEVVYLCEARDIRHGG